jgi:hypothetical protein
MSCPSYCNVPIEEQVLNDCTELLQGGGDQIVVFSCGNEPTDPSDGTEVAALIAAGDARLAQAVKFGIAKASPQDAPVTVSGQTPRTTTYERTATLMDYNVNTSSDDFYNSINSATGQVIGAVLVHLAGEGAAETTCIYINPNKGIQFKGSKVMPDDTNDAIRYEYDLSWKSQTDVQVITAPTGVFA